MGIDVWVRRPEGPLGEAQSGVQTLSGAVAPVSPVGAGAAEVEGLAGEELDSGDGGLLGRPAAAAPAVRTAAVGLAEAPGSFVARAPQTPDDGDAAAAWDALRTEILSCTKCGLHKTRTQGVVGVGPHRTDWMVIGEAPGAEEDRKGEPFVGRAGQLLDAMLRAIGLDRGTSVYIANVLKSRPPGNRDPKPEEVAACLPYLMRQIGLLRPRLMLAVGRIAAQNLLSTDMPLGRLRGKVHYFGELNTPLIVTYHPAYLLRTPADKRKAWEDLKFARSVFRQLTGTNGVLS
jgi:DNA polymerase